MTLARIVQTELVGAESNEMLQRLVAAWLLGYPSNHTRRAYGRDFDGFACWCTELDVDVLAASRVHVDAWARHLAEVDYRAAPRRGRRPSARKLAAVTAFYRPPRPRGSSGRQPRSARPQPSPGPRPLSHPRAGPCRRPRC